MPRINNEKFYTSALKHHGVSAKGVNWNSKDTQELRFEVLLDILPKNLEDFTLVDAGCGFGDFYLYLEKKDRHPKKYIGLDSLYDMYAIASQRTAQEIIIADIIKDDLPMADFYICSGALNVLHPFETQLFIQNCYKSSKKAFVFNVLYGDKQSKTYNYMTKEQILKIADSLHVEDVVFRDGYMDDDISVGFLK
jgi:SAM-dependent methyltransferase